MDFDMADCMNERRSCLRRASSQDVYCSAMVFDLKGFRRMDLRATVIDIGEHGAGMQTNYPLDVGHVLTLNSRIGHSAGVVRWSAPSDRNTYRIGIRFV